MEARIDLSQEAVYFLKTDGLFETLPLAKRAVRITAIQAVLA